MATLSEKIWARFGRKQSTEKRGPVSAWNASASTISTTSSGYLSGSVSSGINSQSVSVMNLYARQGSIESVSSPPPVLPPGEASRRLSSGSNSSKLNQYIAAASAWDYDWDEDDEDDEFDTSDEGGPSTPGSPTRWMWAGGNGSTLSTATPDDLFETAETPEPCSSARTGHARSVKASVSSEVDVQLNRMQLSGASCPALDQIGQKKVVSQQSKKSMYKKSSKSQKDRKIAQSSLNLGQPHHEDVFEKPQGKLLASKSMGCIPNNDIPPIIFKFKKPITYRFTPSGLAAGSKIIWMSENGDYAGKVHWVGKLRDIFHAGVEFEAPIGNSSGIYGYGHGLQTRLFTCKLGYGRFVPVDQLILYEDYYEGQKTGFICIICRDDFVEPGQQDCLDSPDKIMVATKCGHLFHQTCLHQWFNEKPCTTQQCPFCQRTMDCDETIRIYPAQYK